MVQNLARNNGISFSKVRKAGLFKPIKNTKAGNTPLTPGLGITRPNAGQASAASATGFKKRKINKDGNGVPGSA